MIHDQAYDAVIGEFMDRTAAGDLCAARIPVVNLCTPHEPLPFPTVVSDDAAVAAKAYDHLQVLGLCSFAVVGDWTMPFARARRDAFVGLIAASGQACATHDLPASFNAEHARICQVWLDELPRPVGIFAVEDNKGHHLIDACRRRGLSVPHEVAIIGANNDLGHCSDPFVTMSSIDIRFEYLGFLAAELTDRMLAGAPGQNLQLPPGEVYVRQSTDAVAGSGDPALAAGLAYIRANAANIPNVDAVARAAGLSRRMLERRFQAVLGRSPAEEIRRLRLSHGGALLRRSDVAIARVAKECGYPNANAFALAFARHFGCSPSAWRARR